MDSFDSAVGESSKDANPDFEVLLKVISEVTPFIYFVVNDSLKPGIFPDFIKIALVRKKMGA